jgi:Fe2+ transport system protein B
VNERENPYAAPAVPPLANAEKTDQDKTKKSQVLRQMLIGAIAGGIGAAVVVPPVVLLLMLILQMLGQV